MWPFRVAWLVEKGDLVGLRLFFGSLQGGLIGLPLAATRNGPETKKPNPVVWLFSFMLNHLRAIDVERAMGIEPTALAWEARVLPLYDARSERPA